MLAGPSRNEIWLIFSRVGGSPDFNSALWHLLSSDEHEKASRFRFEKHRSHFVVARGLLRTILGTCIGVDARNVEFAYGPHGKPTLSDRESISFNLSGSGDLVVYAVAAGHQLGVDLEYIRTLEDMEKIAECFFCPGERHQLLRVPEAVRAKAFFNCWTRKEAFVKALGLGLSYPLNRFEVTLEPGQPAEFVSIDGSAGEDTEWFLYDVAPTNEYAAALAVKNRACRLRVWRFESPQECAAFCGPDT